MCDHRYLSVLILLIAGLVPAFGQGIQEAPEVARAMSSFVRFNQEHQEVRGWRVQILVTTDRRQMEKVQREFISEFPDYNLHFKHENPFYHLKAGAFTSQAAAWPFLKMMQEKYPDAFLVTDDVELEEVLIYL